MSSTGQSGSSSSSAPTANPPTPEAAAERKKLETELEKMSQERLVKLVLSLADMSPPLRQFLLRDIAQRKRRWVAAIMADPIRICEQCEEEFDVTEKREYDECVYHSGELVLCEFTDHHWIPNGTSISDIESPENIKAHPYSFVWTCCEGDGTTEGCETGKHVPVAKRDEHLYKGKKSDAA